MANDARMLEVRRVPRVLAGPALLVLLTGCGGDGPSRAWRSLGELPAPAATAHNHTPLLVSGDRVPVGTADGLWTRAVDGRDDWSGAGLAGIGVFATRRHAGRETILFAAGQPAADPDAPPFHRSDDAGSTWVTATTFPRNPFDQSGEPFFDLAVAPEDPDRLYANPSGASVAISTDGGLNWALANGENEFLSLFETRGHSRTVRRQPAPEELVDPSVEQLQPVGEDAVAVLISHAESAGAETRLRSLYLLERRGN